MNSVLMILAYFILVIYVIIYNICRGRYRSDAPSANRPTLVSNAPSANSPTVAVSNADAPSTNSPTVAVSDATSAGTPAVAATDPKEKGLDPCVIGSLPLVKCGRAAEDCPICLTQFGLDEVVKLIPRCGHVFHPPCIDMWLLSKKTCPMCRSDQMFGGADLEMGFCGRKNVDLDNRG